MVMMMMMMMNRAILLVGLVSCVASTLEVNAGCVPDGLFSKDVDLTFFSGLDKWLVKKLPRTTDPQANIDMVKSQIQKASGSTKLRAAEIFVKFMEAQQCDDHLLASVKEILYSSVFSQPETRVGSLMDDRLSQVVYMCGDSLERTVVDLYKSSLESSIGRFLEVVVLESNNWEGPMGRTMGRNPDDRLLNYLKERKNRELDDEDYRWASHLERLAKGEPIPSEVFMGVYDKYLVRPCRLLTSTLRDSFADMYVLQEHEKFIIPDRNILVKQLLYAFKQCERLNSIRPAKVYKYTQKSI